MLSHTITETTEYARSCDLQCIKHDSYLRSIMNEHADNPFYKQNHVL